MIYFDTSYLVRLYVDEPGSDEIRRLARSEEVGCSMHGSVELMAAFHRRLREGHLSRIALAALLERFRQDELETAIDWLPATVEIFRRAGEVFHHADARTFLRAADAMHLACAAESGFKEIHSNDRHLLAAAPLFGLKGRNVIG